MQVVASEILFVRRRGHLGYPRHGNVTPAVVWRPQTRQPIAQETAKELWKPAGSFKCVIYADAPFARSQAGVPENGAPHSTVAIKIERIHVREANKVTNRFS